MLAEESIFLVRIITINAVSATLKKNKSDAYFPNNEDEICLDKSPKSNDICSLPLFSKTETVVFVPFAKLTKISRNKRLPLERKWIFDHGSWIELGHSQGLIAALEENRLAAPGFQN